VQRDGQLDDTEVGREVAPVDRADADQGLANLARQLVELGTAEPFDVGRGRDALEDHHGVFGDGGRRPVRVQAPQGSPRANPPVVPAPSQLRVRKRVWTDVAKILSTVCNPFLTSLALFVILAGARSGSSYDFWVLLFNSAFFTSIAPMLFIFYLYATDRISDLDMSIRTERERVFIVFVVFYALGAIDLWLIHAPAIMTASMAGYAASALVVQWITRYWKISTHALGITAPLVALTVLYGQRPVPFYVLIPLIGWSRVYLRAHTVLQVVAGTLLALGTTLLFFRVFHVV
jgi:membrane-associated phospholipid phosphatase